MKTLGPYTLNHTIHQGRTTTIYHASHQQDGTTAVLKYLTTPTPHHIAALQHEHALLQKLTDIDGVIQTHGLLNPAPNQWAIILEDINATALRTQTLTSLHNILPLAITLTDTISHLHQHHIIHKNINPDNILYNPQTGTVKLIDFGIATQLDSESPTFQQPNTQQATLAYISPEQTGRMNRIMDARTDLYSLGVTLYELLTGQLPFPHTDHLALLHAHLATIPPNLYHHNPQLPHTLAAIVMVLLAKDANQRYQTAHGLHADLSRCYQAWQQHQTIPAFPLGQQDISDTLRLSTQLYGRSAETHTLLTLFDAVNNGRNAFVTISGPPGIGKTALVQELYPTMTAQHAYFARGKYGQLHRDIPYLGLIDALQTLIDQIAAETDTRTQWHQRLTQALGPNGVILFTLIPALAQLMAPQPPLPTLTPVEAKNRLNRAIQDLVTALTQSEHPIVLFLDDIQWADRASLDLFATLVTAVTNQRLLLIVAYRDNEMPTTHPLFTLIDELQASNTALHHLPLAPLTHADIHQFITDSLHQPPQPIDPLAQLLAKKTNGNPFFVQAFLKELYDNQLLTFNYSQRHWQWQLEQVAQQAITANVVQLLGQKLRRLPQQTQHLLALAACISHQFPLTTLATIANQPPALIATTLRPALSDGILIPLDDSYNAVEHAGAGFTITTQYRFAHDRVQEAAYALISPAEKATTHHQIGRLLQANTPTDQLTNHLFDIVYHLNLGQDQLTTSTERATLAQLNWQAGKQAMSAGAANVARTYLQSGLALLGPSGWQTHYTLTLQLHNTAVQAAAQEYAHNDVHTLTDTILTNATDVLDKTIAYETLIWLHSRTYMDHETAVTIGLDFLGQLGLTAVPRDPTLLQFLRQFVQIRLQLWRYRGQDLAILPLATDPHQLVIARILTLLMVALIDVNNLLFPFMGLIGLELTLKHGLNPATPLVFTIYADVLLTLTDGGYTQNWLTLIDKNEPHRFAQLALRLMHTLDNITPATTMLVTASLQVVVLPWYIPFAQTIPNIMQAQANLYDSGNLIEADILNIGLAPHVWFWGWSQNKVQTILDQWHLDPANKWTFFFHEITAWSIDILTQPPTNLAQRLEEHFDTDALQPAYQYRIYIRQTIFFYLFYQPQKAIHYAQKATACHQANRNILPTIDLVFLHLFAALAWLASPQDANKKIYQQVKKHRQQIQYKADTAPTNFNGMITLIDAETAHAQGEFVTATHHYDEAINWASQQNLPHLHALACELAGLAYARHNRHQLATAYLQQAHHHYTQWGATAKITALEQHLQTILPIQFNQDRTTAVSPLSQIDLQSVLRASQLISSEIELGSLLQQLLTLITTNAGAQKAALALINAQGDLFLEAAQLPNQAPRVLLNLPLSQLSHEAYGSPEMMLHVAQSKAQLLIPDARQTAQFRDTAYLTIHHPLSILVLPLTAQNTLLGVLYLENNLTTNAFTPERVKVVELLGAQAAISITNAKAITAQTEQERLRLQNEFLAKQSAELAKLNASKDRFFSIVSHDLRDPFNMLLQGSRTLLTELEESPKTAVYQRTQQLHDAAHAAHRLLENLLTWARLQRQQIHFAPSQLELTQLVDNTFALLRETARQKQITLHNHVPPQLFIQADANMVDTIIRNLVANALKFTHTNGRITLHTQLPNDQFTQLTVTDSGVGMPPDTLAHLFTIEKRPTSLGTAQERGTGLGLLICDEMVRQHGGQIWAESEEGVGTAVHLTLPLHPQTNIPALLTPPPTTTEPPPAAATPIPLPPPDILTHLQHLATQGDLYALQQWLNQPHPNLDPTFLAHLQQLTADFRINEIQALLN